MPLESQPKNENELQGSLFHSLFQFFHARNAQDSSF